MIRLVTAYPCICGKMVVGGRFLFMVGQEVQQWNMKSG